MKRKKRAQAPDDEPILWRGHLWHEPGKLKSLLGLNLSAEDIRDRLSAFRDAGLVITCTGPFGQPLVRVDYEVAARRAPPEMRATVKQEAEDYEHTRHIRIVGAVWLTISLVMGRVMKSLPVRLPQAAVFAAADVLHEHDSWPPTPQLKKVTTFKVPWNAIVQKARDGVGCRATR